MFEQKIKNKFETNKSTNTSKKQRTHKIHKNTQTYLKKIGRTNKKRNITEKHTFEHKYKRTNIIKINF